MSNILGSFDRFAGAEPYIVNNERKSALVSGVNEIKDQEALIQAIRDTAHKFIGSPMTTVTQNRLEDIINDLLRKAMNPCSLHMLQIKEWGVYSPSAQVRYAVDKSGGNIVNDVRIVFIPKWLPQHKPSTDARLGVYPLGMYFDYRLYYNHTDGKCIYAALDDFPIGAITVGSPAYDEARKRVDFFGLNWLNVENDDESFDEDY